MIFLPSIPTPDLDKCKDSAGTRQEKNRCFLATIKVGLLDLEMWAISIPSSIIDGSNNFIHECVRKANCYTSPGLHSYLRKLIYDSGYRNKHQRWKGPIQTYTSGWPYGFPYVDKDKKHSSEKIEGETDLKTWELSNFTTAGNRSISTLARDSRTHQSNDWLTSKLHKDNGSSKPILKVKRRI